MSSSFVFVTLQYSFATLDGAWCKWVIGVKLMQQVY